MHNLNRISHLIQGIKLAMINHLYAKFPSEFRYSKGMEYPTFVITVNKIENETFVDSTGQQWKKV